jgi:hypothetical protein
MQNDNIIQITGVLRLLTPRRTKDDLSKVASLIYRNEKWQSLPKCVKVIILNVKFLKGYLVTSPAKRQKKIVNLTLKEYGSNDSFVKAKT